MYLKVFLNNSNLCFRATLAISFSLFNSLCLYQLSFVILNPQIVSLKPKIAPMILSAKSTIVLIIVKQSVLIFCDIEKVIVCVLVFDDTICFWN